MFKDNLYTLLGHSISDNLIEFRVCFNPDHIIYQAHFPNNPITPGVCMVQVIKEVFSFFKQAEFKINKIKSIKFSHPIIPTVHPEVNYKLELEKNDIENICSLKVIIYEKDVIFSKIKMQLLQGEL